MRDLFVATVVFIILPFALKRPEFGIYLWAWISYMNPHRLAYGFAATFPWAYMIAVATFIGLLFSKERFRVPWTRETKVLLILLLWMVVTTLNAVHPTLAWDQLVKVFKILLMTFVTLMVIRTRDQLNIFIWVIVLSLGFYGIKGGIFTVLKGGAFHVQGPEGTFIGGNNEIALALLMTLPLMRYLQLQAERHWLKLGLTGAILLNTLAIVGSQSRGALVGLAVMGLIFWLKSRKKFVTAVMVVAAVGIVAATMPAAWYERMSTIQTYDQDASAQGRINAWWVAFNVAKDRVTGGGFETFTADMFVRYAPNPDNVHDVHSIYFEMLGEHGFVGLGLFLLLAAMTWLTGSKVIRATRKDPEKRWLADLVAMTQVSMIGYAAAGAFLGLAYFDFYYHLICIIVLAKVMLDRELEVGKTMNPSSSGPRRLTL